MKDILNNSTRRSKLTLISGASSSRFSFALSCGHISLEENIIKSGPLSANTLFKDGTSWTYVLWLWIYGFSPRWLSTLVPRRASSQFLGWEPTSVLLASWCGSKCFTGWDYSATLPTTSSWLPRQWVMLSSSFCYAWLLSSHSPCYSICSTLEWTATIELSSTTLDTKLLIRSLQFTNLLLVTSITVASFIVSSTSYFGSPSLPAPSWWWLSSWTWSLLSWVTPLEM